MRFRRANTRRFLIWLALAALMFLISPWPLTPAEGDVIHDKLARLWQQYQPLGTIHYKATLVLTANLPHQSKRGSVAYEFWADGAEYRALQLAANPLALPGMRQDVRWNGKEFQHFDVDGSTLFISANPHQRMPYIAVNPLLIPLNFLPQIDAVDRIHWATVRSRSTLEQLLATPLANAPGGKQGLLGKDQFGTPCTYLFEFGGKPDFLPTKITGVYKDGSCWVQESISYAPIRCKSGTVYLLHSGTQTVYNPKTKRVAATMKVDVISIQVDKPIPQETFTMDYQRARVLVDMDRWKTAPTAAAGGNRAGR